jgi:positive regulator of sigma E activity
LHEDLLLIVKIFTYLTPPVLILLGFILIEVNFAGQNVIVDWRNSIIGVVMIIFGGILLTLELYLNMHKHRKL